MDLQVRILRLIQEREIEKVGSSVPIHVNLRIMAATHRDLEALVRAGAFREDLYYRLAVVPIKLPALRHRSQDIPEFVVEFFRHKKEKHGRPNLRLSQNLLPLFSAYSWPGNIRQLENVVERMVVLCPGDEVTMSDLPDFLQPAVMNVIQAENVQFAEGMTLDAVEKQLIIQALEKFNWNQTRTAQYLGITRKILLGRLSRFGIQRQERNDHYTHE